MNPEPNDPPTLSGLEQTLVDKALALARAHIESGKQLPPTAFLVPAAGGKPLIFEMAFTNPAEKMAQMEGLRSVAAEIQAYFALTIMEAWMVEDPQVPGKTVKEMVAEREQKGPAPRNDPRRIDTLMVQIETPYNSWLGRAKITKTIYRPGRKHRHTSGGRTFGEVNYIAQSGPQGFQGRMTGILPRATRQ